MILQITGKSEKIHAVFIKLFSSFLFIIVCNLSYVNAQSVYNILDYNGQTVDISTSSTPCYAIFTSSSSCTNFDCGVYCACAFENYTITFYSGSPNKRLAFWFGGSVYSCQGNCQFYSGDHLYIYDGTSTASPLMHDITTTNYFNDSIISSGSYITFRWKSMNTGSYWWARYSVKPFPLPLPVAMAILLQATSAITVLRFAV